MAARKFERVIFHSGLPKTATTTVQNALFAIRGQLLDTAGVLYPGKDANHTNALCTAFLTDPRTHITNKAAGFTELAPLLDIAAGIRSDFEREMLASPAGVAMFSAEGMSNLQPQDLVKFRDWIGGFSEKIDVYFVTREPVALTASMVQQRVKQGETLENLLQHPPQPNFKGKIGRAMRIFGAENLHVAAFESLCAHDAGLLGGFMEFLGLGDPALIAAANSVSGHDNKSMSDEAVHILSSLNRQRPRFIDGKRGPLRAANETSFIGQLQGRKFRLPAALAQKTFDSTRNDVAWLARSFGIKGYDNPPAIMDDPASGLDAEIVDRLAIAMSDLMNDRRSLPRLNQAIRDVAPTDRAGYERFLEELGRITPKRTLPGRRLAGRTGAKPSGARLWSCFRAFFPAIFDRLARSLLKR